MPEKTTLKIFIASSAEVKEERDKAILVLTQLNNAHKHLHLKPVLWEYDIVHGSFPKNKNIQDAITPKLKESEFAVFIFFSKLGMYTLEEFECAKNENKKLIVFFKLGFSSTKLELTKGYTSLLEFRESLNDSVLYEEYNTITDFEKQLYANLNLYLSENFPIDIQSEDVSRLSQTNLELIKLLGEKEKEIKELREGILQLPSKEMQSQLEELIKEKEVIQNELYRSEEIKNQLAKDKETLELQLASQKENDNLKAKALKEVEKGNYVEAEEFLKQAAKKRIEETASDFYELAKIKKLQLQFKEAFHYYELATKVDSENSSYLNNAGLMADELGFYEKAIEYYQKALQVNLKYSGEENQNTASCYNNLASAYDVKGEYDKANEYYKRALQLDLNLYKEEHPKIAIRYNNLGTHHDRNKEFDKAIEYYSKALQIDLKFYEEYHPKIAVRYNNLGLAYKHKKNHDDAIQYLQKALEIDLKYYGQEHMKIATRFNNLGAVYDDKGEHDKAITYYNKALEVLFKYYDDEHPSIGITFNNLGLAYHRKAQYDKAIEYYSKCLAILRNLMPSDYPSIKDAEKNLEFSKKAKGD